VGLRRSFCGDASRDIRPALSVAGAVKYDNGTLGVPSDVM